MAGRAAPDLTGSRAAVTILAVWTGLGYFVIIILAGLQTVPRELYDAAAVDGAGPVQSWRHITLPGLRPILIFLVMTGIIDAMARFSDLWTLGGPNGTPARSLQSIVMFMYQTAFERRQHQPGLRRGGHLLHDRAGHHGRELRPVPAPRHATT